ncbi:hypothetical protein [Streptomyces bicolor]|uniref:hypothetical protein n=1 Tax=Streptomyces bicolor TaxID=66874 RepID=UPI0004E10A22|nr:hypothetical protein [Streptomyces bicolor]
MTTDAGLPSVRESLQLALLSEPDGSPLVDELAEAAADHYHLNYSRHPAVRARLQAYTAGKSPFELF